VIVYDVIIIGGSYSGIAAGLQLARARRSVLVLDAGLRRNRFAGHSHGFFGQDGQPPDTIAARGLAELLAYPTVTWRELRADEAAKAPDGFRVRAGAETFAAKRLILATGVVDELPAIPGLSEAWGKRAFMCPYCDGYELGLGRLGVLGTGPLSARFATLVSEWAGPGATTLFLNGAPEPPAEEAGKLDARRITVVRPAVVAATLRGDALEIGLADGSRRTVDGLFLHPHGRIAGPFAEQLGCELELGHLGPYYKTDPTKETTVPGVFACGDVAQPMPAIAYAVADGVRAGASAHQSLVFR
jgi:thioredoxin reductase